MQNQNAITNCFPFFNTLTPIFFGNNFDLVFSAVPFRVFSISLLRFFKIVFLAAALDFTILFPFNFERHCFLPPRVLEKGFSREIVKAA